LIDDADVSAKGKPVQLNALILNFVFSCPTGLAMTAWERLLILAFVRITPSPLMSSGNHLMELPGMRMSTVENSYGIDSANPVSVAVASRNSTAKITLVPFMESPCYLLPENAGLGTALVHAMQIEALTKNIPSGL
jgi:hypothetical protein